MIFSHSGSLRGAGFADSYESDKNANSWRIIRSCIVSSLAPAQFVRVQRSSTKYTETVEGAVRKDGDAKELKFYTRSDKNAKEGDGNGHTTTHYHGVPEERVFIHPSSANFSVGDYSCPWIVYHQLVRTSKPFLRDANECNIYDLLLFGGNLEVSSSEGVIVIDNYARLSANARIGALIGGLRRKVDEILAQKVANPSLNVAKSVEMKLIVKLLRTDGMGI
jgi:ATP-dependent RNA helicase DHX57